MALKLEDKKTIVSEVKQVAERAVSSVVAEYRGLSVEQMTKLRESARDSDVYIRVVRNTLARRALEGTDFECLNESLKGPVVLMFSNEDPGAPARISHQFAKDNEALEVKALSLGVEVLPASQLEAIASLPTRDQALAILMSVMLAPVTKLAQTMQETYGQLVRVTSAVAEKGAA